MPYILKELNPKSRKRWNFQSWFLIWLKIIVTIDNKIHY